MAISKALYCGTCGGRYGEEINKEEDHDCPGNLPGNDDDPGWCEQCGAELMETGSCDNDHGPDVPDGMEKREGVEIGCGSADCQMCYEALRALRDNVERDLSGFWTESTSNVMQQADEAIAKVEGK
jgi:hypothetical protein